MTFNLDPGLLWVEQRVRQLARELNHPVDCLEWPRPGDPTSASSFKAGTIPLRIWRGGEFRIVEFQRRELLEVEGDPEIQRRVGKRIHRMISHTDFRERSHI